jgi:adenylate cyclase
MGVEIERKFLVDHERWKQMKKPAGTHYRQGYLLDSEKHTVRIRVTDKQGYITLKGAAKGISRPEFEYKIPKKDGVELLDAFSAPEVEKIRYRIRHEGKLWEVDEFLGANAGLIVAEIELKNENEAFKKPAWVTDEVSDDERYYNSNLSTRPYKKW